MAFTPLSDNAIRIALDGVELLLAWTSAASEGTYFQIYVAGRLAWFGTSRQAWLPYPTGLGPAVSILVGTVGPGEQATDFSSSLAIVPDRALVTWNGGLWEAPDIAGFHVYMSPAAGLAASYATSVATVPLSVAGQSTSGYGFGGYGIGGYGQAAGNYSWTSGHLSGGVWTFGVKPFDSVGNEGSTQEGSVTIAAPPRPPALNSAGLRLTYTYDQPTRVVTLHWLASPDAPVPIRARDFGLVGDSAWSRV